MYYLSKRMPNLGHLWHVRRGRPCAVVLQVAGHDTQGEAVLEPPHGGPQPPREGGEELLLKGRLKPVGPTKLKLREAWTLAQ